MLGTKFGFFPFGDRLTACSVAAGGVHPGLASSSPSFCVSYPRRVSRLILLPSDESKLRTLAIHFSSFVDPTYRGAA